MWDGLLTALSLQVRSIRMLWVWTTKMPQVWSIRMPQVWEHKDAAGTDHKDATGTDHKDATAFLVHSPPGREAGKQITCQFTEYLLPENQFFKRRKES